MSSGSSDPNSSTLTRAWLLGHNSTSFYSHTYHPPANSTIRASLVFIHGFAENVERYEHVHKIWAERGFFVLAFDLRGFGRTALDEKKSRSSIYGRTSDDDQIKDIKWGINFVRDANPNVPVFLMGHSMVRPQLIFTSSSYLFILIRGRLGLQGGALVLSFATRPSLDEKDSDEKDSDVPVFGIIASSPCLRLTKPPRRITRRLGRFARAIHPNLNVRASVKSKVPCFLP
jgi:acylglycerol lipase